MSTAGDITGSCKQNFRSFWNDCSGFVKAVAADCGILMSGNANAIIRDFIISPMSPWGGLSGEVAAVAAARSGKFVLAGLAGAGHGHVIVITGEQNPVHPGRAFGYWGRYHSPPGFKGINVGKISLGYGSITAAWTASDLNRVRFSCVEPSPTLLRSKSLGTAYHL